MHKFADFSKEHRAIGDNFFIKNFKLSIINLNFLNTKVRNKNLILLLFFKFFDINQKDKIIKNLYAVILHKKHII